MPSEGVCHHERAPDDEAGPTLLAVERPEPQRHEPEPQVNADRNAEQAKLDAHLGPNMGRPRVQGQGGSSTAA